MTHMEHKITICASGAWGIQNIHFNINLGDPCANAGRRSINDIREELMTRSIMAGYPSILHIVAIDDIEDAAIFLRLDSQPLADEYIKRLNRASLCKTEAEEIKKMDDDWSREYGAQRLNFLESEISRSTSFFENAKVAYELLGIDINGSEKKEQILTNLGFYRTNIQL